MDFSKILKKQAPQTEEALGDGVYTDADGVDNNSAVLYDLVDIEPTPILQGALIDAARANGMSEEDIQIAFG